MLEASISCFLLFDIECAISSEPTILIVPLSDFYELDGMRVNKRNLIQCISAQIASYSKRFFLHIQELTWRSGCVMDYHATARGSIPDGNGVKTELHVLHKGQ